MPVKPCTSFSSGHACSSDCEHYTRSIDRSVHQALWCAAVRHVFKSSLPIEIMFAGDADLNTTRQKALEAAADDVKAINVLEFFDESIVGLKGGGWAIKPFAILASSFEQVIIADADVVFVQTPELALDHPGFRRTGTLFYHDRVIHFNDDMHAWWRDIMGPKQPSTMMQQSLFWSRQTSFEMESGVVAFNKSRIEVLLGMLFTAWMNTQSVRDQTTYRHTHGEQCAPINVTKHGLKAFGPALGRRTECKSGMNCARSEPAQHFLVVHYTMSNAHFLP